MKISSQDSKLQVFISSRCSSIDSDIEEINQYNIIRSSIKKILEDTGLFNVFIFEKGMASSASSQDNYLNKIDQSDIVLFLIDNRKYMVTDALLKEHKRAKEIGKPRLYIFYENGEMTSIQKELQGPDGLRYKSTTSLAEIVDLAVESVICEVLDSYSDFHMKRAVRINDREDPVSLLSDSFLKDGLTIDTSEYIKTKYVFDSFTDFRSSNTDGTANDDSNKYDKTYSDFLLYRMNKKKILDLDWTKLVRKDLFDENFHPYLQKRAKAFCAYHEGEYDEAYNILLGLYEELENSLIPKWYIQDILIDLRHLESKKNMLLNIIRIEDGIQKKISNIKTPLYYPLVDRYREGSFHEIIKERNKENFRSDFSVTYGNSLPYIIDRYVYKQYITSISHCSIVHVETVFNDLSEIFLNYYINTRYFFYGEQALDFLIISNKQDVFSKVITKYGGLIKSCSYDKIYDFFGLIKEKQNDWNSLCYSTLFKNIGKFMDDDRFVEVFDEIVFLLKEELNKDEIIISKVEAILKAINSNISRVSTESEILIALTHIFDVKVPRFYGSVIEVLNKMVIERNENINLEFLDVFLENALNLFNEKSTNLNEKIDNFLLDFSTHVEGSKKKIEEFLKENSSHFYEKNFLRIHDQLLKKNIDTWINESLKKIENSLDADKNIPGVFSYGTNFFNELIVTINEAQEVITLKQIDKILLCVEKVMKADFVQIELKSEALDFLLCLLVIEKDKDRFAKLLEIGKEILKIENIKKVKDKISDYTPIDESYYSYLLNIEMMGIFLQEKIEYELLLNLNSRSNEEKIRSVRFIKYILKCYKDKKIETNQEFFLVLKFIVFNFIEDNNNRLRKESAEPLFLLSSFENENRDLYFNKITELAEDDDMTVRAIVAEILTHDEEYKLRFNDIISSLAQDNYYYIKKLIDGAEKIN